MVLQRLQLQNFRNYQRLTLQPVKGVTALVGENGAGKTNILESIHLCCLGKSHRTNDDQAMILSGSQSGAAYAKIMRTNGENEVGVRLYSSQRQKKRIFADGKTVSRIGELMGKMTCVMFAPEDLDMIKGGPALRRRYLDMLLSQSRPAYFYALQGYYAALKQRNALLRAISLAGANASALDVWDEQLAARTIQIALQRADAVLQLNKLEEQMLSLLRSSRDDDIRRQTTLVGPHRDELIITLADKELKLYGSQGQIRTAALALKLAQMDIIEDLQGEMPILLLDDVLSELDAKRRTRLILRIRRAQTLMTCTDLKELRGPAVDCALSVSQGNICVI
jgi:DNA replication and repair protein RecF